MYFNPFARLMVSLALFLVLFILLEDYITINLRGFADRKRKSKKHKK